MAQEAISFCIDLVRINTVNPYSGDPQPGGELAGQNYLQPLLIEAGAEVTRFEPPADIYQRMGVLAPRQRVFTDRPNLAAEVTFGDGTGPRILMQGHIDTVGVIYAVSSLQSKRSTSAGEQRQVGVAAVAA